MLLGDVQAALAFLIGSALTSWATLLAFRLLFPERTEIARRELDRGAWPNALVGGGMLLVPGGISFILLNAGPPIVKLMGFVGIAWLLALAALGGAGLTASVANRMDGLTGVKAYSRAALILVGAANLPLLGWFVFGPAVVAVSLGAGVRAALRRDVAPVAEIA